MSGVHYYGGPRDPLRLAMFEPFDVILCGKGVPQSEIVMLQREFPDKKIGVYLATTFELSDEEAQSYPGPISDRRTGVGRVVGKMDDKTVAWQAARAANVIGSADILMSDNSDPKQPIGDPRLYNEEDLANWREWVPTTMAAIKEAIGDAQLVANVGHPVSPMSVSNPSLRICYLRFCRAVNGIGIEKKTGNALATYGPTSFGGPFREPKISFAFAQDAAACAVTDAMILPDEVVKSWVKWVVVQQWGV